MSSFRQASCFALLFAVPLVGDIEARAEELPAAVVEAFRVKALRIPWKGYYEERLTEPTADGAGGAYQYFRGALGSGAILWSAYGGVHFVFGETLSYIRSKPDGEAVYPLTDPLTGPSNCDVFCVERDTVTRQHFTSRGSYKNTWICVNPNGAYRTPGGFSA